MFRDQSCNKESFNRRRHPMTCRLIEKQLPLESKILKYHETIATKVEVIISFTWFPVLDSGVDIVKLKEIDCAGEVGMIQPPLKRNWRHNPLRVRVKY
jgi:hypothetical protein